MIVASLTLPLFLGTACRTVPKEQCGGKFFPAPSAPSEPDKLIANVEPRSFLGVALDSVTKDRLVGVSFYFEDLRTGAVTDSLGVARIRDLPIGSHRIVIRRLSYEQRRDTIQISPLSGTLGIYELPRRKLETCAVVITS
jgi:hypothetical protein